MKNIRHKVFETNSSSTHSISFDSSLANKMYDTSLIPDDNGIIKLNGGQFGWEYEEYYDAETKASYCAIDLASQSEYPTHLAEMLKKVIKDQTGAKDVEFNFSLEFDAPNWSYIDHQSVGTSLGEFSSENLLKEFIFNRAYVLIIDNDNH